GSVLSCSDAAPRPLHSFPTRRSSDLADHADLDVVAHAQQPLRVRAGIGVAVAGEMQHLVIRDGRLLRSPGVIDPAAKQATVAYEDRKSTRLNSSHEWISYAVFCLKKK